MAQLRRMAREVGRLVERAGQPVYLLDDRSTLLFCNQACAEWVGLPAEMLVGQSCLYHSQADPGTPEAAATGLAPPPEAWSGLVITGVVSAGWLPQPVRRRRACFVAIKNHDGEPIGLLAVLQEEDLSEQAPEAMSAPLADEATQLHEQLRQFHLEKASRYQMDRLVGQGVQMRRVRAQVEAAVASGANVLIVGPPGSGRQHTAQAIYYATETSTRGPLVPLDCDILPEDLIQSTLVNLARRYSPAGGARPMVLLHEVDQLPEEVQKTLEAFFMGPGAGMRVLATSRIPLLDLAEQGAFPLEWAAWLSTIVIALPALAQRREDIPLLAQAFVEQINAQGGKQVRGLTSEALDRLDGYDWPGNLDELAQMVAQAHAAAQAPQITPADLPQTIHLAWQAAAHPRPAEKTIVFDEFLGEIQRELLRRALRQAKGNKAKAARLLGLTRPRLYRLLLQYGLLKD